MFISALTVLFTDRAKREWVIAGCRSGVPNPKTWEKLTLDQIPETDRVRRTTLRPSAYEGLDPGQRIAYLCISAGLRDGESKATYSSSSKRVYSAMTAKRKASDKHCPCLPEGWAAP